MEGCGGPDGLLSYIFAGGRDPAGTVGVDVMSMTAVEVGAAEGTVSLLNRHEM